jgi:hypothetical protein
MPQPVAQQEAVATEQAATGEATPEEAAELAPQIVEPEEVSEQAASEESEEKGVAPYVVSALEDDGGATTQPMSASISGAATQTPDLSRIGSETGSQTAPTVTGQYAAPLGTARRYGRNDADLPVDVGEDEKRLHNDARRFARLLVSEIKLYNEQKVQEGRTQGDIYDRLREDIDRSRQMYDKRVAPPVAARYDYFHHELVSTLAEGDPSKLGDSYPGATVTA